VKHAFPLALGTALLFALTAQAAVDPALFADLHWRSIGPFRGGRVLAVDGVLHEKLHFYFGAVNGGVWETRDAGRTWQPIFDREGVGSIGALAVAPSNANVIYVGTGEADMRSDIAQGIGLFRSDNGGRDWRSIGLADTQQIGRILVDPRDADVVLVAALGHSYGPNAQRGVFRSTDGGKSWTRTLFRNADTGAIDLAFAPNNPDIVYASLWQTRRPPWNTYPPSSGPGGGLFKSTDGGKHWTELKGAGLPDAPGRIGLALSPAKPDRIYALIDAVDGGLYRSDDAGAHWTKASGDKRIWNRGWYFGGITANPQNADEVYVCDTIVLRSNDGGRHFIPLKGDPTGDDFHALWIDPGDPARRILGSDQGTQITLNGGVTWSSWYNQPTGQFYHVVTDNRFPYRVYGAQQDSGAAGVPSRTGGIDGIAMPQFHELTAGGESDNIAPDPDDPDIVYGGRVDRLDLKSEQTRSVDPTMAFPDTYRETWTLPLVFGPRDHALYFGNQRIFRTADGGQHWRPISPDLTRSAPGVPATLDAPTIADVPRPGPRRGVIYAIGPSPRDAKRIWAGTDDGLVWRTEDGGAHWLDITPKGLAAWSKIGSIEPSHFDDATAYIAVDRHRLDDFAPYIDRTQDGGKSWTRADSGIAAGGVLNAVNVVREDPQTRGLLFAGTERGAFVSFDNGDHWQALQSGLPPTSVRDIVIHGDDLVIATHGRSFYIMDDIAPLRALARDVSTGALAHDESTGALAHDASAGARLFAPAIAYRTRPAAFTGTPMPKDEPMAPNPPNGAYIDYVVPQGAKGPVTLEIDNASGARVRAFSSATTVKPPDLAEIETAPEWIAQESHLATAPGEHRFVWDLHEEAPAALDEGDHESHGVWAMPGRYTLALTIGGAVLRQPLELRPDPRIHASLADYQREFALAHLVETARVQVRGALKEAKALHVQLTAALAKASAPAKPALASLDTKLVAFAELPPDHPRNRVPPQAHAANGLEGVSAALDGLAQAVDGADGRPTADAETAYRLRAQTLGTALRDFTALKTEIAKTLASH
jgi:photosystem II stability/assembly factor-like uncharacterized protein